MLAKGKPIQFDELKLSKLNPNFFSVTNGKIYFRS